MIRSLALAVLAAFAPPAVNAQTHLQAEFIAATELSHPDDWFGGFSGIEMASDGTSAVLLSDRGWWLHPEIRRKDGIVTGLARWKLQPILGAKGFPLPRIAKDSEGLARLPDGRLCVSFEGRHRVSCFAGLTGSAETLPRPEMFNALPPNRGFEALAADVDGQIYAIAERAVGSDQDIPVYVWNGHDWAIRLTLPPQDGFLPVGADILDDHLYVLLRGIGFIGFKSRLLRMPLGGGAADIVLETSPGTHDNLEGLSLWRNPRGQIIATMISDDNHKRLLQRTEIVEYRLPDPSRQGALASGHQTP